ncbi:MAG: DUF2156 domain-containing protein [Candidatus Lokiarchaeota archaeon]|nr:DUF2156 domain-containing protein [Candidatus Lokiarchaeota archaeon]
MSSNSSDHREINFINLEEYGFKPLELEDKSVFAEKLEEIQPIISEFTFTNLWMWREYYKFAWKLLYDGNIILVSLHDHTKLIAFPMIGNYYNSILEELVSLNALFHLPIEVHRVPEKDLQEIINVHPLTQIIEDRDNWDYVYKKEDLLELSGGNYEKIRRKLNKFEREYKTRVEVLSSDNAKLCLELQETWCDLRSCSDNPSLDNEDKGIRDILLNFNKLDYTGLLIFQKDKIIGFSIGERLNTNTIIVHVEKGDTKYSGIYQALNHSFVEKCAANYKFVNREQDLGVEGLRRSKMEYNPDHFIKKYITRLSLKN